MFPEKAEIVGPDQWGELLWGDESRPSVVGVDFETFYSSKYSVRSHGTWRYCHHEQFDAYLVAISDGLRTCVCRPESFPWHSISGMDWVSHNRDFDRSVYERLGETGVLDHSVQLPDNWFCSAALCAYLQLPRELALAVQELFGVPFSKDIRAALRGKKADSSQGDIDPAVLEYAARDAGATLAIWHKFNHQWPEHERKLFEMTSSMGSRGLAIEWDYVREQRIKLESLVVSLGDSLPWRPALSIKQFRLACEGAGVEPPKSTSVTDPGFLEWTQACPSSKASSWVRGMQRIRSANRTAKVLQAMETRKMPSSRMAFELKYFGASTGRWSGNGGLNLQNLNRSAAEGVDLRRAIIAPPGHKLAVVDYAQIESRVLLYLAGDTESLSMFRENPDADAYEIHARSTMGYTEPEPLHAWCERTGSNLRQVAKARVLGLGFGCGYRKFIEVAKVMAGLDLGEMEATRIVKDFRKSNPLITQLWRLLHDAFASHDGRDYYLPLPCTQANPELGRHLIYRDVLANDDGLFCTVRGERIFVHGGLLAENWTQATARDVMASAWLRCADAGYHPILTVHDELVFEVPVSTADQDLQRIVKIMAEPLDWAPNLPLKACGRLMEHYQK